jgi:hypothetical protein
MTDVTPYETIALNGMTEIGAEAPIADDADLAILGGEIARLVVAGLHDAGLTEIATRLGARVIDTIHREATRLAREHDVACDGLGTLIREQDGSEIASVQLEQATERTQRLEKLVRATEALREGAAETFANDTGEVWLPRTGSGSRTGHGVTAATIEANEMRAARRKAREAALDPEGRRVVVSGSRHVTDIAWVYDRLDRVRERLPDMVLVTRDAPGCERIAKAWAAERGVAHIVEVPEWSQGKSAPFKANDRMLAMKPAGVVVFGGEGEGIPSNLADKAEARRIRTWRVSPERPTGKTAA